MATYEVSTATQFNQTLARAVGGDTIRLAAGNYGNISIKDFRPGDLITIQSADPGNPAHFDTLQVRTSQNLTFRGLDIGRPLLAGEPDHTQMAMVRGSSRIVFDTVQFHSSLDGNPQNDGYGLFADNVTAMTIINSNFEQLTKGLVVSAINNLQISNNRFEEMRSDGLNVAGSKNVVVENNVFQGFYPLDFDHPDAMQFYNLGYAEPMSDVTIRNNVLLPGGTYGPQGVWVSDPGTSGFRNFTIENNLLWSEGSYNGIGLVGLVGGKVTGNTLLSPTTDAKIFWVRMKNSSDIDMRGNLAEDYLMEGVNTNIRMTDNANLRTNPGLRSQIADVNTPETPADLIVRGFGFQLPAAVSADAPVSGAVGNALKGMLSVSTGASVTQMLVDDAPSAGLLDLSRLAEIVAITPVAEALVAAPIAAFPEAFDLHAPMHVATPHMFSQDWFTALP